MSLEEKTIRKIVDVIDYIESNPQLDYCYDEMDAYSDICNIISHYQNEKIKQLKETK